jgi:tetratricopeptide (TPR) repeat protein
MRHWFFCLTLVVSSSLFAGTDYEKELAEIDAAITTAKTQSQSIHALYRRACLTGNVSDIKKSQAAVQTALEKFGSCQELYVLAASLELKLHRFAEAKSLLERIPSAQWDQDFALLQADLAEQDGRYRDAADLCQQTLRYGERWDALARCAHLDFLAGDLLSTGRNFSAAEPLLTAKDMRSFAWLEVQRGRIEFQRGNYSQARRFYQRAEQAYSGYWLTEAALAEVDGAERNFAFAIARYEKLIAATGKPEFRQALGDLYSYAGKPGLAKSWHDQACAAFLASARQGEEHFFHHLTYFFADTREDGPESLRWAQADFQLRKNAFTADALAWAFFRDGEFSEALSVCKTALAFGVSDCFLLYHAGVIHLAANQSEAGRKFLAQAAQVNPNYENFHAHY